MAPPRVNMKSVEAKARKSEQKKTKMEAERKAKEDALWVDNDKHILKKEQRKQKNEEKLAQKQEKKNEKAHLEAMELQMLKDNKQSSSGSVTKMTRAQIAEMQMRRFLDANKKILKKTGETFEVTENLNQTIRSATYNDLSAGIETISTNNLDDTLAGLAKLNVGSARDNNIYAQQKSVATAKKQFIEEELKTYKIKYPHLKRSQALEKIHKMWDRISQSYNWRIQL